MSKSSTASAQKILPTKSAWAKGPPPNTNSAAPTPRSQSPAPSNATPPASASHSRRPSALGQGIPIKDGVSVPRSTVGAVKQGSAVTFGSIDDVAAPISTSPSAAPAVKSEGVKSFGSVPAGGNTNGKTPTSKPSLNLPPNGSSPTPASSSSATTPNTPSKPMKMDIKKLFQGSGSSGPSQPPPPSETASPSTRPSNLPTQQQHPLSQQQPGQQPPPPSQPSQLGAHPYTPFVPSRGLPSQQNNGPARGPPGSPVYSRQQLANGSGRPPGGPNGPGGPPMSAGLSSPRLAPHTHPGQPSGMPPPPQAMPVPGWPGHFYQQDPYMQQYYGGWYMPGPGPGSPLPHQQHPQHHPHPHQQHPPSGPPGPHPGMPMSPRNPPPSLQNQAPGTPTQSHALPNPTHTPHQPHSTSNSISGLTSPPPTPSNSQGNLPGSGPASARLNTNASAFVPGRSSKIVIKSANGEEVDLSALKKGSPGPPASPGLGGFNTNNNGSASANRRSIIRMESEDARKKRVAEEKAKEEKERAKKEAEEKEKRDAEEKVKREEEERVAAIKRKEEEEKERLIKEEEERVRKVEEEKERIRKETEERERLQKEEEERVKKEEAERIRIAEEEKKAAEEAERIKEEEEAKAAAAAASKTKEEGEIFPSKETPADIKDDSKEKSRENLRIDTAATPPAPEPRKRPGPLNLSGTSKSSIPAPLPSALSTARIIEDIGQVPYPEGIQSPKVELNINAKDGKFKYDRDFLLQFMSICKEKPDMLPPLDAIGLEPSDQSFSMSRGGSGRHSGRTTSMSAPNNARSASVGLGIGSFGKSGAPNPFSMGNFATPGSKMSSEERFALANSGRAVSAGGPAGLSFGRPAPMVRSPSQGGPGAQHMPSNRTRSKRGEKRNDGNKVQGHQQHGGGYNQQQQMGPGGVPLEPVAPLVFSEHRWTAGSTSRKPQAVDPDSPEIVDRKVKGLLNKLTMEKFDSISDQIIAWANKSEKEKDGRTLIQVIRLVFEKATDEAAWSEMYARLCRKMMEQISPKVQDDGIKNADGKPIAGGQLFRKYLLNRCQEDFERGWAAKDAAAAAAVAKASEDEAAKMANDKNKDGDDEPVLYSEEYYTAQKAKRQGLGLIKFIGELFKLQMLTERIMHECIKKLLGNVENPEEEEIESLCKLLTTVGQILDNNKARAHMDVYFSRMKELTRSGNVSSRMQFMLQDIIELRDRKWITRNLVAAPSTIAQIHEGAAKDRAAAEKESYQRQISMSRGGSRRGGERGQFDQAGPDGWAVAGGANVPARPPPKAGDLSNFGKINKTAPMTFGPSSVFAGKKDTKARAESLSRTNSSSNMFSMLSQNPELAAEGAGSKSSRPPSRKTSVDLGQSGVPEAPTQRKRLNLLPRSKPTEEETAPTSNNPSDDEGSEDATMSEADAKKKIDEDSKEFFAVRNLEEAEDYFAKLTPEHRFRLVDKLVASAIESKETDAQLVGDFFSRASSKDLCTPASFEEGFLPTAEILDDIAIDAPKAFNLMAIMMKGAGLDDERRGRIAGKSMDSEKLVGLLSS